MNKVSELAQLPNVGKVLEQNLIAVGITTPEELRRVGAKEALLRIRATVDPGACVQMLYGLQGALEGIPDKFLSEETKADLRAFHKTL